MLDQVLTAFGVVPDYDQSIMKAKQTLFDVTINIFSDPTAVENSVTSPYSNGILEGNNNRLKLIKRMMYGRAKLPLLRAKVLASRICTPTHTRNCG